MKRNERLSILLLLLMFALAVITLLQPTRVDAASSNHAHLMDIRHHAGGGGGGGGGGNLTYHGGQVMSGTAHVYAIFWEPKGSYVSPTYNSLILRFFGDIGHSALYHNNVQYPDGQRKAPRNAALAGSWVDTQRYKTNPITDTDIQTEVSHAQQIKGWTPGSNKVFFVFTAKGENVCWLGGGCSFSLFCGYHFFYGSTFTFYATIPYEGTDLQACGSYYSPNHDIDADSSINVASHELMESVTDAVGAWYDSSSQEIGDKCSFVFGPVGSDGSDAHWNGHPYIVQEEWDNTVSNCVMQGP